MDSRASRFIGRSLVGLLALVGCATVQSPGSRRLESAAARFERIRDSVELASSLEQDEMATAPRIRLVVHPATYTSTRYVEASFRLSEDAYVLVVAVDLDRRVRVLYPETADQSGFAAKRSPNRLTRFFAGFGGSHGGSYSRHDARYDITQRISPFGGGGVVVAVASDRPLQLERLSDQDGDWDEHQLSQLIFDQSLPSAAHAVGRAVVLTGQEYNTDYTTFDGGRTLGANSSFASSSFGDCGYEYGYFGAAGPGLGYGSSAGGTGTAFVGFYQRDGRTYARYAYGNGSCSRPFYYDVPVVAVPMVPRDTTPRDSTKVPRRSPRFPGAPRVPSVPRDSAIGPLGRHLAGARRGDGASVRLHPPVVAGLRFRPPEQMPGAGLRPFPDRLSPRDVAGSPIPHRPWSPELELTRPSAPERGAGEVTRPVERERPIERRQEPRPEPVRAEPVRTEPAPREAAQREPARSSPTRSTPR